MALLALLAVALLTAAWAVLPGASFCAVAALGGGSSGSSGHHTAVEDWLHADADCSGADVAGAGGTRCRTAPPPHTPPRTWRGLFLPPWSSRTQLQRWLPGFLRPPS